MKAITRDELFRLAWTLPLKTLAAQFGVSDVGLRKACVKAEVPLPGRGYWAQKEVGKTVEGPMQLPPRPPGMREIVEFGSYEERWRYNAAVDWKAPPPLCPMWEEPLTSVRQRVTAAMGAVACPRNVTIWHPAIQKLRHLDDARRAKQAAARSPSIHDGAIFDTPYEQRRLRVLNALFIACGKFSGKPRLAKDAGSVAIQFFDCTVELELDHPKAAKREGYAFMPRQEPADGALHLTVNARRQDTASKASWADSKESRIEAQLREIAVHIVVAAEILYREAAIRQHEWTLKRREELQKQDIEARAAAKQAARDRAIRIEKARVKQLLLDAENAMKAKTIRCYVNEVRSAEIANPNASVAALEDWASWALTQADAIDPLIGARYLGAMTLKVE